MLKEEAAAGAFKEATSFTKRFCFEAFCVSALFELYPMAEWDLMIKINKLNRFVKKTMILYAGLRQGEDVEIDA
jgi:hypothetical protein